MASLSIYWHTIKYLKPVQIYGRLARLLPRRAGVSGETPVLSAAAGMWVEPARPVPSMLGPRTFRFLNEERDVAWPASWRPDNAPLLWLYHLHYFDDLNAISASSRRAWHHDFVDAWITDNPVGAAPAWDSYPTSLRIVNWIKWSLGGKALRSHVLNSLAQQARWLSRRLEWHLLGNHLFANAKALVFAGCYFSGDEADRWVASGTKVLANELNEQVLSDGGNFELSPMYHAIFLSDVLDLINLAGRFPGRIRPDLESSLRRCAGSMLGWLRAMVHPDGQIALFNDSAIGAAPTLDDLSAYARRLSISDRGARPAMRGLQLLDASGYARLENERAVVMCDVAEVGPEYLPGHAHADTLSFELSVDGKRTIVNGGTSRYGADAARLLERSTAAHSTVVVNGCDSSEVWGGFRVARRARPFGVAAERDGSSVRLEASHDGYRRLDREIIHRRSWLLTPLSLTIEDQVCGPWKQSEARFLLHHEVDLRQVSPNSWSLGRAGAPNGELRLNVLRGRARVEPSAHSLEFGKRLPTHVLIVELERAGAKVEIAWQ